MRTIGGALLYATLLLGGFPWLALRVPTALLGTFLLGGIVSIGPGLQIWLMGVAGQAKTLGAALTHSAINFANALGAWLGGLTIAASGGFLSLGWTGALLGLGGCCCSGLHWPLNTIRHPIYQTTIEKADGPGLALPHLSDAAVRTIGGTTMPNTQLLIVAWRISSSRLGSSG